MELGKESKRALGQWVGGLGRWYENSHPEDSKRLKAFIKALRSETTKSEVTENQADLIAVIAQYANVDIEDSYWFEKISEFVSIIISKM